MLAIPDPKYPIDWYPVQNSDLLEVCVRACMCVCAHVCVCVCVCVCIRASVWADPLLKAAAELVYMWHNCFLVPQGARPAFFSVWNLHLKVLARATVQLPSPEYGSSEALVGASWVPGACATPEGC